MSTQQKTHRLLIAYDLIEPNAREDDYADLYKTLKKMKAKRIQESVWALRTDLNATDAFTQLQGHLHGKDRLLVTRIGDFLSRGGINKIKFI